MLEKSSLANQFSPLSGKESDFESKESEDVVEPLLNKEQQKKVLSEM